jgi:dTDP-4-amino-4,6-dideoxygalactose transaminase
MHPFYRQLGINPNNYPNSLSYYERALSLPLYFDLTNIEQAYVLEALNLK